jgi:hypothetical protein
MPETSIDPAALVGVYFQTSSKYRYLARFPAGFKGAAYGVAEPWKSLLNATGAESQYLRVHAPACDRLQLTPEQFAQYKAAGGGTYEGSRQSWHGWPQ